MKDLPKPLTPADCDLRGFDNLQLDVDLLPKSKLANYAEAEAFRAAVLLWCEAWKQVPAASLPDDDLELRAIVGLQRDADTWSRIKADALSKFIKCSDGRLYHEILAEKANKAWEARQRYRERGKAGAKARAEARAKAHAEENASARSSARLSASQAQLKQVEGEGEGEGEQGLPKEGKPCERTPSGVPPALGPEIPKKQKQATRLLDSWKPPPVWIDFAISEGLTEKDAHREADKFRDYWIAQPGAKGRKVDWQATWRNWVRRAVERLPIQPRRNSAGKVDDLRDVLDQAKEFDRRERESVHGGEWDEGRRAIGSA